MKDPTVGSLMDNRRGDFLNRQWGEGRLVISSD